MLQEMVSPQIALPQDKCGSVLNELMKAHNVLSGADLERCSGDGVSYPMCKFLQDLLCLEMISQLYTRNAQHHCCLVSVLGPCGRAQYFGAPVGSTNSQFYRPLPKPSMRSKSNTTQRDTIFVPLPLLLLPESTTSKLSGKLVVLLFLGPTSP